MPSILILLIFMAIIVLIVWVISSGKRRRGERLRMLEQSGFSEVLYPDHQLIARISSLCEIGRTKIRVRRLFVRSQGVYSIYMAQFWHRGDGNGDSEAFLVDYPNLRLPEFQIGPAIPWKGKFGKVLNLLVKHALAGQGWAEVEVAPDSQFARQHFVYARDSLQVQMGSSTLWERLGALPGLYMVRASNDLFMYRVMSIDAVTPYSTPKQDYPTHVRLYIETANRLCGIFETEFLTAPRG